MPPKQIAADENLPLGQIYRKKRRLKTFKTINPFFLIRQGRPRSLTREYEKTIEDFLDEYPQTYLNEIIAFI